MIRLARSSTLSREMVLFAAGLVWLVLSGSAVAADDHDHSPSSSSFSTQRIARAFFLRDYNTRIVAAGSTLLGAGAGLAGVFLLLRQRALAGDVISHSALPGVAIAFLVLESWRPGSGKSLPGLLVGAALASMLGMVCVTAIRRWSRIKEDAAQAIVLSVFFGASVALMTVIRKLPSGDAAGLNHFILGKTSSMTASDVQLITWTVAAIAVVCLLLFKEFSLLCFDEQYGRAQGWPVVRLDLALMLVVVVVTVVALQSVGALLALALLVIPASAARFWSDRLRSMAWISTALGAASGYLGVMLSASFPRLSAGPVIVLTGAAFFAFSLLAGTRRGVLARWFLQAKMRRRVGRHDLLRAFYELLEHRLEEQPKLAGEAFDLTQHTVMAEELQKMRSWPLRRVRQLIAAGLRRELLVRDAAPNAYRLTKQGAIAAWHAARNHRLWELYLIRHAAIAPSHVDRDADHIEHLLEPAALAELEAVMVEEHPHIAMPESPHRTGALRLNDEIPKYPMTKE